jgi:hypothetical protein
MKGIEGMEEEAFHWRSRAVGLLSPLIGDCSFQTGSATALDQNPLRIESSWIIIPALWGSLGSADLSLKPDT